MPPPTNSIVDTVTATNMMDSDEEGPLDLGCTPVSQRVGGKCPVEGRGLMEEMWNECGIQGWKREGVSTTVDALMNQERSNIARMRQENRKLLRDQIRQNKRHQCNNTSTTK